MGFNFVSFTVAKHNSDECFLPEGWVDQFHIFISIDYEFEGILFSAGFVHYYMASR